MKLYESEARFHAFWKISFVWKFLSGYNGITVVDQDSLLTKLGASTVFIGMGSTSFLLEFAYSVLFYRPLLHVVFGIYILHSSKRLSVVMELTYVALLPWQWQDRKILNT